jgi:tripartite-type tricarboxylate transporter receptor subunit TctC
MSWPRPGRFAGDAFRVTLAPEEKIMKRLFVALATSAAFASAVAQDFPSRPVKIVVPWPPSGNVDITARTLAPAFSDALGQQVIVENRAGAAGTIGTTAVVKSVTDGYTLLLGSSGTITSGPAVLKNLAYDPLKDLAAVGAIQSVPIVLTAAPKTPVSSYREFFAYAQSRPGQVSIASAGSGSSNHLAIELLMRLANLKLLHVPYKGSGPAITDLLGSQVESMMDQLTASIEHIRGGRVKALAVTSKQRSPLLPNVPTLDELGVTGYEASTFTGIFAPAGVPSPVVEKLHRALRKALANPSLRARYHAMGVDVLDMSQAEFAAYVRVDYEKWRRIAREGNIVVE